MNRASQGAMLAMSSGESGILRCSISASWQIRLVSHRVHFLISGEKPEEGALNRIRRRALGAADRSTGDQGAVTWWLTAQCDNCCCEYPAIHQVLMLVRRIGRRRQYWPCE